MTIYKVESPIAISSHRIEVTSGTADDKVAGSILAAPGYFSNNSNKIGIIFKGSIF